jgi:serpin B
MTSIADRERLLVIANAVYFKGDWVVRFDRAQTAPFARADGSVVDAPTMHSLASYRFAAGRRMAGRRIAVPAQRPRDVDTRSARRDHARRAAQPKVLTAVGSHLSEQEIDLSLPRWDSGPEPLRRHLPRHITVDEQGTEAGAVTGTAFIAVCGRCGPPAVRADHPFAFAIVHRPTKTPLFIGHVADPTDTTEAGSTQN